MARFLYLHQRIDYKALDYFDQSNTLSHYLLFRLAEFERILSAKGQPFPGKEEKKKQPIPTTDAEAIFDFSQEQYHLARQHQRNIRSREEDKSDSNLAPKRKRPRTTLFQRSTLTQSSHGTNQQQDIDHLREKQAHLPQDKTPELLQEDGMYH